MHVLQLLLVLSFALLSQARLSTEFVSHAVGFFEIKDFLISDVVYTEVNNRRRQTSNHTLSFHFTDPNANSSISCSDSWLKDANGNHFPSNYVYCAAPTTSFSIWKLTQFTTGGNFSLALAHFFSDPSHYPPPYDYVEYFAEVALTPVCSIARTSSRCIAKGPIAATINRISN
ncbi:hypothetical protein LZ554_006811 [Drepanopeziza brunnea f. sp. 'monogermtubi']|nr:hypothetical protein LZ554_006811 [Drepanopeziza brunnea f. sp. 'monogermtubi']